MCFAISMYSWIKCLDDNYDPTWAQPHNPPHVKHLISYTA